MPKMRKEQNHKVERLKNFFHKINIIEAMRINIISLGYHYSIISFFKTFSIYSITIIGLAYLHRLYPIFIILLLVFLWVLLPFSIVCQYRYLYEQKRFQELCRYLKQMKINYKTSKKILSALEETLIIFNPNDRIYQYIYQAISAIKNGKSFREALDIIETHYKTSYISKMHAYMILGELNGGNSVFQALDNIDYNSWQSDTYIYNTQKYKYQNQIGIYTIIGLGISLSVTIMFDYIIQSGGELINDLFNTFIYQVITFLYVLIDLISYISIKAFITEKWIKEDE